MNVSRTLLTLVMVGLLASPALADWDPGDDHKMHFPQLPDPEGWDVNFSEPKVLADDWRCTATGAVRDIHFWMSSREDDPFQLEYVRASIHLDDVSGTFSKPGDLKWQEMLRNRLSAIHARGAPALRPLKTDRCRDCRCGRRLESDLP